MAQRAEQNRLARLVEVSRKKLPQSSAAQRPRTANALAAFLGFLPVVWTSLSLGWGLVGIWSALTVFVLVRLGNNLTRLRSDRWAVLGVSVPTAA